MPSLATAGAARLRHWLRAHPTAADTLLAAVVFASVLLGTLLGPHTARHPPGPCFVLLSVAACGCLAVRRKNPRAVLAATSALTLIATVAEPGRPAAHPDRHGRRRRPLHRRRPHRAHHRLAHRRGDRRRPDRHRHAHRPAALELPGEPRPAGLDGHGRSRGRRCA
ncbi:hypothetical protein GCM10020000_58830 [Streptomyces olivoverticillatus]